MEQKLQQTSVTPKNLTFQQLKDITNNFSDDHKVGRGGFGEVYKGVLHTGEIIAVKKLYENSFNIDVVEFKKEFNNLMRVEHENIVRLVGFCYETQYEPIEMKGRQYIFAERTKTALCFEYFECGGLDKHLSDESCGLDWHTRFKIIKGVCEGLNYLHNECKDHIYHLDMKPGNILLDKSMMPKIADLGSSILLKSTQTYTAEDIMGTRRYMPPEYIDKGKISKKLDVFSLGVIIIEIMSGPSGYSKCYDMPNQQFAELVHENWKKRFHTMSLHKSYEAASLEEVKMCIEMALRCIDADRKKRPTVAEVINKLNEIDTLKKELVQYGTLEDLQLWDEIGEPLSLKLSLLQTITNDFSKDLIIGRGGYAVVYKGVLRDDLFVAVKKLHRHHAIDDEPFQREVDCLMSTRHPNIIRFVGYCAETSIREIREGVENRLVKSAEKLLCFEYLGNGSLRRHLTDKAPELQWCICYQVIKGICLGLHYLHDERHMVHLDLTPNNILLDDDMVPKIADFGNARLMCERSYIASEKVIGTRRYMAPEYKKDGKITVKSDIYSLGIIIREIVMAHSTGTTTEETFLNKKILDSWMRGQEHNSSQLKQIKECVEIAEICTEDEPENRPAIGDILHRLEETEAGERSMQVATAPGVGRTGITKIGPWGGNGGNPTDINVAPHRLESLTICIIGTVIGSLSFSYYDRDEQQHTGGPWGGCSEIEHKIHPEPTEFLVGISGTSGMYGPYHNIITSLTFTTDACSYGPYGLVRGDHFDIPVHGDGYIVGFFGRAQLHLDAIGAYVNMREAEDGLAKFGPWGGDGGRPQDIEVSSTHLESVTIYSGVVIDSLAFSYRDQNGQCHTAGPWGGDGGDDNMIWLGHSEFLTGVVGTIGRPYKDQSNLITSLVLVTNARSYGPFGEVRGTCFHIPVRSNGRIVGFFGRADQYVNAIGVYTNHNKLETMQQAVVETDIQHGIGSRIGPWGGNGGAPRDITVPSNRLESMTIFSGRIVDSFEFSYRDHNGHRHTAGPWGGSRSNDHH